MSKENRKEIERIWGFVFFGRSCWNCKKRGNPNVCRRNSGDFEQIRKKLEDNGNACRVENFGSHCSEWE